MMQDVYQIEAFRIPLHVELTELMEMKVTLKMDCEEGLPHSVLIFPGLFLGQ